MEMITNLKITWFGYRILDHTHSDPFEMYVDSIYWAVASMTSTGYGDFHATNEIEMCKNLSFCI